MARKRSLTVSRGSSAYARPRPPGHPFEQPFRAEAQRHKGSHQQQQSDQAAIPELEIEDEKRPVELRRKIRQRRNERTDVLTDGGDPGHEIVRDHVVGSECRRRRSRRRSYGGAVGGALPLQPLAYRRIIQQLQERVNLRRSFLDGSRPGGLALS
jgi:hypothetical protein